MTHSPITRRGLLFTAGAGVMGIAVVGTVVNRASATDSGAAATPTADGGLPGGWQRVSLSFVSAYVLVRGEEVAVVDLGIAGSGPAIQEAITATGKSLTAVRHLILTHYHADHSGGLAEIAPLATAATVYAGAADVGQISSPRPLTAVRDGDEVFGLQIVGTPGHTAGHVSVFEPDTGVLVAGDALRTTAGLAGSDPQYTADAAQAAASVRRLATLPVKAILPGHGDPLTTGAAEALQALAASLPAG